MANFSTASFTAVAKAPARPVLPCGSSVFKDIWAIRIRLQLAQRTRELALFNLAVAKSGRPRSRSKFPQSGHTVVRRTILSGSVVCGEPVQAWMYDHDAWIEARRQIRLKAFEPIEGCP